jgi:hypothetical protein
MGTGQRIGVECYDLDGNAADSRYTIQFIRWRRSQPQDVLPKSTSLVSTVPAVRPGAAWSVQYRLVCAMTLSGGGAPTPTGRVLRRVGVADQGRVVPSDDRAVERRADARIGLRADDDESSDAEAG